MWIQLFSRAREVVGAGSIEVDMPEACIVGVLRERIAAAAPGLRDVLAVSRVAVNHEFAGDSVIVLPSDEVAIIPPVSGG